MRIAAGVLMTVVGIPLLVLGIFFLSHFDITGGMLSIELSMIIPGVLLVTGGGFCLRRRHWRLCFVSALLPVLVMVFWVCWTRFTPYLAWFWVLIPAGTPAIIFVWLRKREWQKSQA